MNKNANNWNIVDTGLKLTKEYGSKPLVRIYYGEVDDYPEGNKELSMYMRKDIYNKLIKGEYKLSGDCNNLIVLDKYGDVVEPLAPDYVY